jgi:hypothetical protein
MEIITPDNLIPTTVPLIGEDGNAFAIIGRTAAALKRAGNDEAVIENYREQAMSGDYDHLLAVTLAFTDHACHEYDLAEQCHECGSEEIEEDSGECNWCGEIVR